MKNETPDALDASGGFDSLLSMTDQFHSRISTKCPAIAAAAAIAGETRCVRPLKP